MVGEEEREISTEQDSARGGRLENESNSRDGIGVLLHDSVLAIHAATVRVDLGGRR